MRLQEHFKAIYSGWAVLRDLASFSNKNIPYLVYLPVPSGIESKAWMLDFFQRSYCFFKILEGVAASFPYSEKSPESSQDSQPQSGPRDYRFLPFSPVQRGSNFLAQRLLKQFLHRRYLERCLPLCWRAGRAMMNTLYPQGAFCSNTLCWRLVSFPLWSALVPLALQFLSAELLQQLLPIILNGMTSGST